MAKELLTLRGFPKDLKPFSATLLAIVLLAGCGEPEPASTRVFWRAECLFEVDTKTLELTIKSCARPGDGIEI